MKTFNSFLVILFIFLIPVFSQAQFKNFTVEDSIWHRGVIKLTDGGKLKGVINYNPITEVLELKRNGSNQTFSAENVEYFFLKDSLDQNTYYYSIPFDIRYSGSPKLVFFRIYYENSSIAILSRYELIYKKYITAHEINLRGLIFGKRSFAVKENGSIREIVYLADSKGQIVTYLQSTTAYHYSLFHTKHANKKSGGFDLSDNFDGLVGSNGLKKILGQDFKRVERFKRDQKIELETLPGLRKYIDYYNQLRN